MLLRILCVHIEINSLWVVFVNKNRCIMVLLYPRRIKAFNVDNFNNSHNSFLRPEYFIDFFMRKMDPMSVCDISVLCLHYRPETLQCSTKDAYTSEITFFALLPWSDVGIYK